MTAEHCLWMVVKLPVELRMEMVSNNSVGKRLLNVEEAAGYLGLKVDTVYKKARLRELPFVKVGRALRFDKQALDREMWRLMEGEKREQAQGSC